MILGWVSMASNNDSQSSMNIDIGICQRLRNYLNRFSVWRSLKLLFGKEITFEFTSSEHRDKIDFTDEWELETVEMYSYYIHDDLVSVRQNYAESCKRLEQIIAIDGVILTILAAISIVSNPTFLTSFLPITLSAVFSTICIIRPISVEDSYRVPDAELLKVANDYQKALQEMINTDIRFICTNSAANNYKRDIQKVSGFFLLLGLVMLAVSVFYTSVS